MRGPLIEKFAYCMEKTIKAITKTRNLKNTKIIMVFFVVSTFRVSC